MGICKCVFSEISQWEIIKLYVLSSDTNKFELLNLKYAQTFCNSNQLWGLGYVTETLEPDLFIYQMIIKSAFFCPSYRQFWGPKTSNDVNACEILGICCVCRMTTEDSHYIRKFQSERIISDSLTQQWEKQLDIFENWKLFSILLNSVL